MSNFGVLSCVHESPTIYIIAGPVYFVRVLERITHASGVVLYHSPLLAKAGVRHAFSTRLGGLSSGPFDSMNLGNPLQMPQRDDLDRIEQNYQMLQHAIGLKDKPRCWVHQVHGGQVVRIRTGEKFISGQDKADALVTDDSQRMLAVRVADCAPVLLASEDGRVVAAVHSGWRGVIARIVPNAIAQMQEMTHVRLIAAIGPCIGGEAFEVGPEVIQQFRDVFGDKAPVSQIGNEKGRVDIRAAIELQLLAAGISPDRIDSTDRCTHRDSDEFFSHRRENGVTGRMAAIIAASGA